MSIDFVPVLSPVQCNGAVKKSNLLSLLHGMLNGRENAVIC